MHFVKYPLLAEGGSILIKTKIESDIILNKMTKYLVTLAILCVFGAVIVRGEIDKKAMIADFMAKAEVCKGETGGKDADIADMVARKPASTPEGKCMRSCLMKKYGAMNGDGKLDKVVAREHAEMYTEGDPAKMTIADEVVAACDALAVSGDHCEAAEEYLKCFKEQAKAHGIEDIDF
ncbi:general odorant-binding protein 28a [Stomoxys calcitrans]|uniref:Uncharacterized protein n=1 Tax=Stomoxys calcitrans TaxID=35570 RepID=A0A1I8Q2Q1_STOCA|nr:general odorant-binding protein 28a [Stomoxys calcitrans]